MRRLSILLSVLFIFPFFHSVHADQITVSGDVSGTWSVDTVLVVGEIRVPAGETLIVDPGVQVRFTGLYKFIVQGRIDAIGMAGDSIVFTRHLPTEESKWRGFRFDGADNASVLEYCRIEYAKGEGAYPDVRGGAIWIDNCSPAIRHCLIAHSYTHNGNYNGAGGGICLNSNSFSIIEYNRITQNQADSGGGILVGSGCDPQIRYNLIEYNEAFYAGGAIYVSANAQSSIYGNEIGHNSAGGWGGGGINLWSATWLYGAFSNVYDNLIIENTASDAGGGIYSRYDASQIYNNTIVGNQAGRGGGIYVLTFSYLPPVIVNSIIRENLAPTGNQIYLDPVAGSTAEVSYSDIEGGWPGLGIIDEDPLFISTTYGDYRLQWRSPCIDSGDPNPQYTDPDGTVADMGAYYYDQSIPVRILLTPHDVLIEIPNSGGSFDYTIQATNIDPSALVVDAWCDVTLPDGSTYGPVLGPVSVTMNFEQTISRDRTQNVPAGAPSGVYIYNAYAAAGSDTSFDSFAFVKLGSLGADGLAGWFNTGEAFGEISQGVPSGRDHPTEFALLGAYPNPFNPVTALSYQLLVKSYVSLSVYDVSGRLVTELVNGWRDAGVHEVMFDGSDLASGVYLYRLNAGDFSVSGKMVLMQ